MGDHAENFHEIGVQMRKDGITFSDDAIKELSGMHRVVLDMFEISKEAFENLDKARLSKLTALEEQTDQLKQELIAKHFSRLQEGHCSIDGSQYYSSTVIGLERVADHLVNIGYSILNPTGSQREAREANDEVTSDTNT